MIFNKNKSNELKKLIFYFHKFISKKKLKKMKNFDIMKLILIAAFCIILNLKSFETIDSTNDTTTHSFTKKIFKVLVSDVKNEMNYYFNFCNINNV
jgi:hypothetical protein